jgi:hypothetical protein
MQEIIQHQVAGRPHIDRSARLTEPTEGPTGLGPLNRRIPIPRALLTKTAVTSRHFFRATPAAAPKQRHRAFAEPPSLRNCLRRSKIECFTS